MLVAAEDSQEAPHLGKRLAARLLDGDQRLPCAQRIVVEEETAAPACMVITLTLCAIAVVEPRG